MALDAMLAVGLDDPAMQPARRRRAARPMTRERGRWRIVGWVLLQCVVRL
jgi:hypothetical protein